MDATQKQYLDLLSESFSSINDISAEIITDKAVLSSPKKTELFVSDIHGEYESFAFISRSACGNVKKQIEKAFGSQLSEDQKNALITLVCYPGEKTALELQNENNSALWLKNVLKQLITLCKQAAQNHSCAQIHDAI